MRDLFSEISESIRRNRLRTCLTGFAVAWGIFMLIVLLGAGNGVMNAFGNNLDGILTNTMMVGGGWTSKPYDGLQQGRRIKLTEKDVKTTLETFPDIIDDVDVDVEKSGLQMNLEKISTSISLCGISANYAAMNKVEMIAGRFINANDLALKRKCIVITNMQYTIMTGGDVDYARAVGRQVRISGLSYLIVGVRKSDENGWDNEVFIPFTTMKTIFGLDDEIGTLTFSFHGLGTQEENDEFEKQYKAVMNGVHRAAPDDERALWIWNRFTQNMQSQKGHRILSIALWIIGLFTLLSGVVGVSNIMLITVKERTHEFGIRKAIGASPWQITRLIMAESITITAFFGYIGMVAGLGVCEILDATLGQNTVQLFGESRHMLADPSVSVGTAAAATLLLITAGIIAGLFPARKAARIRPIEALRAD